MMKAMTKGLHICLLFGISMLVMFVQCVPGPTGEVLMLREGTREPGPVLSVESNTLDAADVQTVTTVDARPEERVDMHASDVTTVEPSWTFRQTKLSLESSQTLAYVLRWDWEGARWDSPSGSYVFTNDLGYTVGLRAGYLSAIAMQMVACPLDEPPSDAFGLFPFRLGVRTARADHSFTEDRSLVSHPIVEKWGSEDRLFGIGESSGRVYCQVHILYASLSATAPDGEAVKKSSIVLSGWVQYPGESRKREWKASTSLAGGSLLALTEPRVPLRSHHPEKWGADATLVLVRRPVRAFAQVDFARMEPVELAYQVLNRLSSGSLAHIVLH